MKEFLILHSAFVILALASCTTSADGTKAFLGLNGPQWLGVGTDAAKAAAQGGLIGYASRRAVTAAKNPINVAP